MARSILLDDKGRRIALGPQLGRGGEATVYSVAEDPALVAKIYHHPPDPEKAEKLYRMVELQNERLLSLAAWPVGTLRAPGNQALTGFLMRNISGLKDLHLLYNPKSRAREFPAKANWRFLLHTAANLARAFCVIHDHGHVIGDVNQSNVRVSPDSAVVSLVDCDSFQISSQGKLFLCEVGVPLFTPPELQDKEFRDVVRTPNHDNFGLAVLIFHLLLMGRHPFAGKFLGRGEMPIEKAIGEFRFAFSPETQSTQMQPPPACITLAHLPPEFTGLFENAFSTHGPEGGRPDGKQWIAALDSLGRHLMLCSANSAHVYFNGLASCPWCPIESTGILLFVEYAIVDTTSGFSMEILWSRITAVQNPGPANQPSLASITAHIEPSKEAKAAKWKWRIKVGIAGAATLSFLIFSLYAVDGLVYVWIFVTLGIGYLKSLLENPGASGFEREARSAEDRLRKIQYRWQQEASEKLFITKLQELRTLTDEYRHLPDRRKQKVRELERALYNTQLRHYLEQFDIASANIPHIKDGRKAMLSAYGIDDAADVTQAAIEEVPGFGQFLIIQLITWRQSLEAKFTFNPGRGVDTADVHRVDLEIAKRRSEIELLLCKGPGELAELRRRIIAARGQLQGQLEQAALDVAQAQADERAAA